MVSAIIMASSIKLFQFLRKFQRAIGISASQSNREQCSINFKTTIFLISSLQFAFTVGVYLAHEASGMFAYGFGVLIFISLINGIIVYLLTIWQAKNTSKCIENCERFIEKSELIAARPKSIPSMRSHSMCIVIVTISAYRSAFKGILQGIHWAIGTVQYIFFCCFVHIDCLLCVLCSAIQHGQILFLRYERKVVLFGCSRLVRMHSQKRNESIRRIISSSIRFPFDWKTPHGYLVAYLSDCVGCVSLASAFIQFLNLLIGSCWLFIYIADDITSDLAAFNADIETTEHNRAVELLTRLCDIIRIYSDAKQ